MVLFNWNSSLQYLLLVTQSLFNRVLTCFKSHNLINWLIIFKVEHFDKKYRFEKWKIEQEAETAKLNRERKYK